MANITIQQAYALALGAFVDFTSLGTRGSLSSVGLNARATSQKNNKLSALVATPSNAGALNLGDITLVQNGTSTTLLTDANNLDNNSYNLVTTSSNEDGGTLDYLVGSPSIDSTTGTLSAFESNLHKSGRVIFNKLKK
jgi:hypothetical protein